MKFMRQLWNDESGFVVSGGTDPIATIAALGVCWWVWPRFVTVSRASCRTSRVRSRYANQSYSVDGVVGHNANWRCLISSTR